MDISDARPPWTDSAEIAVDLERRILTGEYPVGARLPSERALVESYHASRPIVREVLRRLDERGYIEVRPSRGSFVRGASQHDLAAPLTRLARRVGVTPRHIVSAREALEASAARAAAEATRGEVDAIEESLREHEAAGSVWRLALTDLRFHEAILHAAGNPVTEIMFGSIRTFVLAMMLRSHSDTPVRSAGDPMHRRIMTAVHAGDGAAAWEAMREHVTLALELYGPDLDLPIEEVLARWGIDRQTIELVLQGERAQDSR